MGRDLLQLALDGTHRVTPLLQTKFDERNGIVSPDGRWLAYESNSSGSFEIYVRPFPNVGGGQWQVSTAGGTRPLWARSGKELFYVGADGALLRVPVEASGATWNAGTPTKLLEAALLYRRRHQWPHVRRVARRPAVPDDQSARDRRGRRAARAHRRATLGRGAEAPRADEIGGYVLKSFVVIAIVAALCGTPSVLAQSIAGSQPNDYGDSKSWLCRPGRHDACDVDLTTTIVAADGALKHETGRSDPRAPIDCFYVYPTVSTDATAISDMNADLAELNVARLQFARFSEHCRLYAPLYRQVTLAAGRLRRAGGAAGNSLGIGYDDVLNAWNYYLQHDNRGRGVVLIGHSQGATVLKELIRKEVDGKAVQSRLVSALLIGLSSGLAVPRQQDVGGTFQHVPLCRIPSQTGCVIAYSSFRSTVPPPADTMFGKVDDPNTAAACTILQRSGEERATFMRTSTRRGAPSSSWYRPNRGSFRISRSRHRGSACPGC